MQPERVALTQGTTVALTAELPGAPAGTPVRWVSEDTTVLALDTTTTGPHRVIGRGGRRGGVVHVNVLTDYALVRVQAVVLTPLSPR